MHWAPALGQRALQPLRWPGRCTGCPAPAGRRSGSAGTVAMRPNSLIVFYVALARALVADGGVAGADHRACRGKLRLAVQRLDHQVDHRRDLVGFRAGSRACSNPRRTTWSRVCTASGRNAGCEARLPGHEYSICGRMSCGLSVVSVLKAVSNMSCCRARGWPGRGCSLRRRRSRTPPGSWICGAAGGPCPRSRRCGCRR